MESDSNFSGSSSNRIQNLVEDLGDENFGTRNEALMTLKAMLPVSEVSISNALIEVISDHGDNEAGSSTSFVNKGAIELFQHMSELGLEPLVNDLLKNGDVYARRVATDAMGRTGRMAVLPYLVKCMNDGDMYVRWQAAKGLGRFAGSSDARDALVSNMDDSEPYVRKRVARSLESFGGAADIDGDGTSDSEDEGLRKIDEKHAPPSDFPVLSVKKLRKEFGGLVAVKEVSFEVNKGEFVGLIGPNGCGKSTTFNCISGSLAQTAGTVNFFGEDVSNMRPDEIQKIGMTRTFQHTRLWREMTVIENLLVPPRDQFKPSVLKSIWQGRKNINEVERLSKAYSILDQLEVPHMAENLTSELSGGQSKLVDIGRSMMGDPKLLLLDEPVAGVAGPLAMKIFSNLRKLVDDTGISVLIIEHNMDFILRQGVDRIVVMNEGEVLMVGSPDEVKGSKEVISAYLGSSEDWEWEKLAQEDA